jgi:hypothetical protein
MLQVSGTACRFTASNNALWDLNFANGTHTVKEFPQLWWRKYRNFRLAETEKLYLFDNPNLCFSAPPLFNDGMRKESWALCIPLSASELVL